MGWVHVAHEGVGFGGASATLFLRERCWNGSGKTTDRKRGHSRKHRVCTYLRDNLTQRTAENPHVELQAAFNRSRKHAKLSRPRNQSKPVNRTDRKPALEPTFSARETIPSKPIVPPQGAFGVPCMTHEVRYARKVLSARTYLYFVYNTR